LSKKCGSLTDFHPDAYSYSFATGTITNSGIVVAGNKKTLHNHRADLPKMGGWPCENR
jgi:hypothetical protein